jgi:hypothetical protein
MGNNEGVMDRHIITQRRWNPDVTSSRNMSPGFWWILVKIAVETVLCRRADHPNCIFFLTLQPLPHQFGKSLINLGSQKWKHKPETILVPFRKNKSEFF